ncbi:GTPase Era [Candidatus Roizmanbacteria bacterium RIFCSPLOWO2_02_FULL_43_10]|uniref:GTPase Era n=2 Tax=Candidatus Roizmaniibacteriota TaxID=1752723 RepID=A0A1F7K1N6_9BACT|nr:MAG: GTPase Era [Candidatus Roizmanbacteria bacterium RIFCSPHIGHO2_02_FULL_43_11]OGK61784.1 MAG: GTPase Era [Candidatus Roizmanbacteria bacterium RIFCSPLOWO2_02_FULL_43_10]
MSSATQSNSVPKRSGTVALIGRPNVGKSTLVNNLIGQKVAITSPKPQTTRFPIEGLYQDERGQIIFIDTPGIFLKAKDPVSKRVNEKALEPFNKDVDLALYLIDHTRKRDFEEAKVVGITRKLNIPKVLVINKIDVTEPTYRAQYRFLEEECDAVVEISALNRTHLKTLLETIFTMLPERDQPIVDANLYPYPAINLDSRTFIAEIIREKVFLRTRKEVPYTTTAVVDNVIERDANTTYIQARVLTTDDTYKKMLIGAGGRRIKEIGTMARKELETATNRKIYLDLTVETDRHWPETLG